MQTVALYRNQCIGKYQASNVNCEHVCIHKQISVLVFVIKLKVGRVKYMYSDITVLPATAVAMGIEGGRETMGSTEPPNPSLWYLFPSG